MTSRQFATFEVAAQDRRMPALGVHQAVDTNRATT
jgi:hypothetical protein